MGSSVNINSISIDLAGAANEIDMVKCDNFSIRGFVAETRKRDLRKCWPFSEESFSLVDQQSYTLPSLSVPKSRWWESAIKDTDADGPKDCGVHTNSRTRNGKKLVGSSSVNPSQSKMNTLAVVAGNVVEENEIANRERSQKDDQIASTPLKNVHPPSMDASTVRSKSRKLPSPELVGDKRSKEKVKKTSTDISSRKEKQKVDQAGPSEIAGAVDDTPPKAIKNRKGRRRVPMEIDNDPDMSGSQPRKTRKLRLLSELNDKAKTKTGGGIKNTRKEESSSKRESARGGRKRKKSPEVSRILSTAGETSENASKSCGGSDRGDGESTDSGFERDPIKGKKRNRRFQVVDEFVPSLPRETSQEGTRENDDAADAGKSALSSPVGALSNGKDSVPCPPSKQRRERTKLSVSNKKKNKLLRDYAKTTLISLSNGTEEGNQVKPRTGPSTNAISQPAQALLNEDDVRLASEGYVRKCIPQLNDKPVVSLPLLDNDHGSTSKSNAGKGWLRTGMDVVEFNSNNNNKKDDASGADRKGKTIMVQEHEEEAPIRQSQDTNENTTTDEKEVAEIMVKQFEMCLPDKEGDSIDKQPSQETTTPKSKKKALLIDLNETYDNGVSMEDNNSNNNTSRQVPKPVDDSSARKEEPFQIGNQPRSIDFFAMPQPYTPSPFGIFRPPIQDNRASSSSNSMQLSGRNCSQWIGNVPTLANHHQSSYPSSFRTLPACNGCSQSSAPHQHREGTAPLPLWPSSMIPPHGGGHHVRPVSFNLMNNQSANLGMLSQASSSGENTWSLNFVASNGRQTCGSNNPEFSFGCNHGAAGVNGGRSLDGSTLRMYSVTDPRLGLTLPGDHNGNGTFSRRHFPPVNYHPQTNQLPFDRRFVPETSRTTFPVIRQLGSSSSLPFQAQAHHQARTTERNDAIPPSVVPSNNRFQLLGESNTMRLPLRSHVAEKETRKAESFSDVESAMRDPSGAIVCTVSRNPADFTTPEAGNVFMLSGEDLRVQEAEDLMVPKPATYKRRRASLCKQDALKRTKKPAGPVTNHA